MKSVAILSEGPPGFVVMGAVLGGMGRAITVVHGSGIGFVDEMTPLLAMGYHPVDGAPIGETANVTVVDEEVGLEFATEMGIIFRGLLGIVAVGSVELHATLTTPLEGLLQELALTTGPENQTMAVGNEHLQRLNGEGDLCSDLRVTVLNNCTVKIYCDYHVFLFTS